MSEASKPHSRREESDAYYKLWLDENAKVQRLEEQLEAARAASSGLETALEQSLDREQDLSGQLEVARRALAFFDPDDDADAAIAFAWRLNPEWGCGPTSMYANCQKCGRSSRGARRETVVQGDIERPGFKCECGWWNWLDSNPAKKPNEKAANSENFSITSLDSGE